MQRIPDDVVDAVEVVPGELFAVQGRAGAGEADVRRVLEAFVTLDREDGEYLLEGAALGQSRGTDGGAFAFPEVSGEDGVVIEVGAGRTVLVGHEAFGRLLERLREALAATP